MNILVKLIPDIMVIAVVLICILTGRRHGFMRTVIELVGYIAVVMLSIAIANYASGAIYNNFVSKSVTVKTEAAIAENGSDVTSSVDKLFEDMPAFVLNTLDACGITKDNVKGKISGAVTNGASAAGAAVSEALRSPITSVIAVLLSITLFIIGMVLVKLLAKLCNGIVNKIPIVGKANSVLGAIVGAFKGVVIVCILVWIIAMMLPFFSKGILGITSETVENSYIFSIINNYNPLV